MKMEFTSEQIKAMIERAVTILVTIFLAKMVKIGWLSDSDSAMLLPFLVILPSLAYAWWVNRNKALIQAVARTPDDQGNKQVVVTSPTLAAATPDLNIVSNESVKIPQPEGAMTK